MSLITIRNLSKRYAKTTALWNLDLDIEEGAIFGFIGPNGAGKTTTLRILATLLQPTTGTVLVNGHDVVMHPERVRPLIGYLPDQFGVYQDMRVGEYLEFFADCFNVPRQKAARLRDDLLELVDLSGKRNSYVDQLSRGMQQRLCLARTLMHDPKVLLLDEPAANLDPRARIETRELLKELRSMGKTILVSSHILADLAEICSHVAIIEQGRLLAAGSIDQLTGLRLLKITVIGEIDRAVELLRERPDVAGVEQTGQELQVRFKGEQEDAARVLATLTGAGIPVVAFGLDRNDLEEIFLRVTKGAVA